MNIKKMGNLELEMLLINYESMVNSSLRDMGAVVFYDLKDAIELIRKELVERQEQRSQA